MYFLVTLLVASSSVSNLEFNNYTTSTEDTYGITVETTVINQNVTFENDLLIATTPQDDLDYDENSTVCIEQDDSTVQDETIQDENSTVQDIFLIQ